MKRTHRHLEVVVGMQADYVLPEGKAACPQASNVIVPGLRRLLDLTPDNCAGVLFVNNYFTPEEYKKSDYASEFPPHCLVAGFDDYEPVGVQNVFSSFLLSPRGIPVYRGYKKQRDMWGRDMWENHMRVATNRGSSQNAETLPQFHASLEASGVSNVTIWGVDAEFEVAKAIDGFLVFGYKVCVMWDLCKSRSATNTNILHTKFSAALGAGQLEIVKYGDQLEAAKRKPL